MMMMMMMMMMMAVVTMVEDGNDNEEDNNLTITVHTTIFNRINVRYILPSASINHQLNIGK